MTLPHSERGDWVTLEKHLESRLSSIEETMRVAYPDRKELLALLDDIKDRITCLEISKAQLEGKADRTTVLIYGAIAIIALVVSIVDKFQP